MESFRKLFFSAVFCGVFVAPVWGVSSSPDLSNKLSGAIDAYNKLPTEVKNKIDNFGDTTEHPQESSNNTDSTQAPTIQTQEGDPEIDDIFIKIADLGWCPDDDTQVKNPYKQELCKRFKSVEASSYTNKALDENTQALEENYQNMKDKENSFENRMLGAAGIGTVGIGGMMAASALVEQNADTSAENDMKAYLATMQCKVGNNTYDGGTAGIEVGGANQLINMYQQYAELAADLKERKNALGLAPGIEAEIVIDKATSGLYDDVGTGIGSGAYASIARALQDPNGADAQKWNEQKNSASTKLKTGAGVAVAGAVASAVANYAINHDNKDKSQELLAEREKLLKDKYAEVSKILLDECNQRIREHKEYVKTLTSDQLQIADIKEYKDAVDAAHEIKDVSEIADSSFCR